MSLECSECERDLRGGHDPSCSRFVRVNCKCGHERSQHDEEGVCIECNCQWFTASKSKVQKKPMSVTNRQRYACTAYVVKLPNGRYFVRFGRDGRLITAWSLAGAKLFGVWALKGAQSIADKINARSRRLKRKCEVAMLRLYIASDDR